MRSGQQVQRPSAGVRAYIRLRLLSSCCSSCRTTLHSPVVHSRPLRLCRVASIRAVLLHSAFLCVRTRLLSTGCRAILEYTSRCICCARGSDSGALSTEHRARRAALRHVTSFVTIVTRVAIPIGIALAAAAAARSGRVTRFPEAVGAAHSTRRVAPRLDATHSFSIHVAKDTHAHKYGG